MLKNYWFHKHRVWKKMKNQWFYYKTNPSNGPATAAQQPATETGSELQPLALGDIMRNPYKGKTSKKTYEKQRKKLLIALYSLLK